MRLQRLKDGLKAGNHPRALGATYVGEGTTREVFAVGPFVVKKAVNYCGDKSEVKEHVRTMGARMAPTVRVGDWEVQLRYQEDPIRYDEDYSYPRKRWDYDIHSRNIGKDRRGRWVVFDW